MRNGLAEGGRGFGGNIVAALWRKPGRRGVAIAMVLLVGAGLLGKSSTGCCMWIWISSRTMWRRSRGVPDAAYSKDPQVVAVARRF